MQNLDQIRARHVLAFANDPTIKTSGQNGGEVIKKISPVLMNNGLLQALAYSLDEKQVAWRCVFDAVALHLASPEIALVPEESVHDAASLLDYLVGDSTDSQVLRMVTAETSAWLDFARRLA